MNLDTFKAYCAAKPGVTSSFPFDQETLVFKVCGKMFALTNVKEPVLSFNLKCDPEWAHVLRETYPAVKPGWHMNKQHWNTVTVDGSIPEAELLQLIDHSYDLVVKGLKKADREQLERLARLLGTLRSS
jgi:predicted DNA-binding protein (MmcQ/YjbR family)